MSRRVSTRETRWLFRRKHNRETTSIFPLYITAKTLFAKTPFLQKKATLTFLDLQSVIFWIKVNFGHTLAKAQCKSYRVLFSAASYQIFSEIMHISKKKHSILLNLIFGDLCWPKYCIDRKKWLQYFRIHSFRVIERLFRLFLSILLFELGVAILTPLPTSM